MVQLYWTDYQKNISSFITTLQNDQAFADVTLVSEDDYQIETNKVVLSASSLFFRKILTKNIHDHPLIYLRGIASEDLKTIMDFLFTGEVQIKQERVSRFMSICEDLQVRGVLEEFVGQNENVLDQEETNIEHIKEKEECDEQVSPEVNKDTISFFKNEYILDDIPVFWEELGICKYPALIAKFGVRYAKCSLCRKLISADKTFLTKHWQKYHSNSNKPNKCDNTDIMGNIDDDMADLPEFWEAGGLCNAALKDRLKSENFNRCLVCNKLIGTEKKQLLKHWKTYHFEKELERSDSSRDIIVIKGSTAKKGRKINNYTPFGGLSKLKYQCKACDTHPRGNDLSRHYEKRTDWGLLANMRGNDVLLEEAGKKADPHTLFMFENGYTKNLGPNCKSHQQWKG